MATLRQQKVFKKVSEKVRNGVMPAISREMLGIYKKSVARKPYKLTRSKGWKELMEKELPDGLLAKRHRELLNKREVHILKTAKGEEAELIDQPDTQAVSKGLDMAYKLKNRYPKDGEEGNKTLIINITGETARRYGINSIAEDSSIRPA